jgi:peptidoglycan/LPS O-acetylase OafA/YrhL
MLHNSLLLPAFGALLWSVASGRGRVLGSRPFVAVGKATYDLYILQMPLMYWVLLASQKLEVSLGGARFLAVFVPLVLVATVAVHRGIVPVATVRRTPVLTFRPDGERVV